MRKMKAFLWKRTQCQLRLHAMRDFHKTIILFRFREVIELASLAISLFQEKRSSPLGNPWASPVGQMIKNPPANAGDAGGTGLILGLERSPGEGNSNPLQYSCLENSMDRRVWRATVLGGTKRWIPLSE